MTKQYRLLISLVWLSLLVSCAPSVTTLKEPQPSLLAVDPSYAMDSLATATIAPFKAIMDQQMQMVIGYSNQHLEKGPVESLLGNFVADVILAQSRLQFPGRVDFSVVTTGGLRAPIPEGPIKVSTIYELMPFENLLYILELDGVQTKAIFDHLALRKRTAVANSVVLLKDDKLHKLFVDGEPFKEEKKYVLAISDYLAEGGDSMDFLKDAKVLARVDVKIRDMIIDHIKWMDSQGQKVDAALEGRVKILP